MSDPSDTLNGRSTVDRFNEYVEHFPIEQVLPYDKNPKRHPQRQIDELAADFKRIGFQGVIVIDENNAILSGHGRWLAAKAAGFKTIPVHRSTKLTEGEKAYYRIRDNSIPLMADFDEVLLQSETDLAKIEGLDPKALEEHQPRKGRFNGVELVEQRLRAIEDESIPCEPGDWFQLGEHRIVCGDSTKSETYNTLLPNERAEMLFTDPPYGVTYVDRKGNSIQGDTTQSTIPLFFKCAIEQALDPNARIYVCGASSNTPMYFGLFDAYLRRNPHIIVWVKEHFALMPHNYHTQYEFIFFSWLGSGGGSEYWYGDRTQSDVWEIARDASKDYIHPTQKPVELAARAMINSCKPGGLVLEPFLGSGSTLIAAHATGRICRGIEIDPKFVRKVLMRFFSFTRSRGENPSITRNGEELPLALFERLLDGGESAGVNQKT